MGKTKGSAAAGPSVEDFAMLSTAGESGGGGVAAESDTIGAVDGKGGGKAGNSVRLPEEFACAPDGGELSEAWRGAAGVPPVRTLVESTLTAEAEPGRFKPPGGGGGRTPDAAPRSAGPGECALAGSAGETDSAGAGCR
jgi:hypothetical protein